MSIKILGRKYFKNKVEKEREILLSEYTRIAEIHEEYLICHQADRYTERLEQKQERISKRLDEIGWGLK